MEIKVAGVHLQVGDSLVSHCKDKLASYKVPKVCIFVETLPKNNTGKIDLRKLKKEYL